MTATLQKRLLRFGLATVFSLILLSAGGCMSGDMIQQKAEENFSMFLQKKNSGLQDSLKLTAISCSGQDSPERGQSTGDGYVSCTAQNNVGKEFVYLCGYGYGFTATNSCKANNLNILDYNPSQQR